LAKVRYNNNLATKEIDARRLTSTKTTFRHFNV